MNKQETTEFVYNKLYEQGEPSRLPGKQVCLYRGPRGLKCAIGHLISDEEYSSSMEGYAIKAKDKFPSRFRGDIDFFFEQLQTAHDEIPSRYNTKDFRKSLSNNFLDICRENGLDTAFIINQENEL